MWNVYCLACQISLPHVFGLFYTGAIREYFDPLMFEFRNLIFFRACLVLADLFLEFSTQVESNINICQISKSFSCWLFLLRRLALMLASPRRLPLMLAFPRRLACGIISSWPSREGLLSCCPSHACTRYHLRLAFPRRPACGIISRSRASAKGVTPRGNVAFWGPHPERDMSRLKD